MQAGMACAARLAALAALALVAAACASAPQRATADVGATMRIGAGFVAAAQVDRIAGELDFDSVSPGIDGGVNLRFGRLERGVSGTAGVSVFWTRRRRIAEVTSIDGFLVARRESFHLTALGLPVGITYSIPGAGGRFVMSGTVAYHVATVRTTAEAGATFWFPDDGGGGSGERVADGAGFEAALLYERSTRLGALGGGVSLRRALLQTDDVQGAAEFDVDLSGVAIFLSLSVRGSAVPASSDSLDRARR
jgi:hypothetical protein